MRTLRNDWDTHTLINVWNNLDYCSKNNEEFSKGKSYSHTNSLLLHLWVAWDLK